MRGAHRFSELNAPSQANPAIFGSYRRRTSYRHMHSERTRVLSMTLPFTIGSNKPT